MPRAPAARRRRRRHGQPIEWRRHRLRDGVGRWPPRSSRWRWPGPPGRVRSGCLTGYPTGPRRDLRWATTRSGAIFVRAIGHPAVMKFATRHGLRTHAMQFVLKLLANLTDPSDGDAMDRIINGPHPHRTGRVIRDEKPALRLPSVASPRGVEKEMPPLICYPDSHPRRHWRRLRNPSPRDHGRDDRSRSGSTRR